MPGYSISKENQIFPKTAFLGFTFLVKVESPVLEEFFLKEQQTSETTTNFPCFSTRVQTEQNIYIFNFISH